MKICTDGCYCGAVTVAGRSEALFGGKIIAVSVDEKLLP